METKSIQIAKTGGPSVMKLKTIDLPKPKKGEVTVRHTAIGFNFIDINHRTGRYPLEMPTGIGSEAAGVIEAVGRGVTDLKVGQRVVYIGAVGTYSEAQNVSANICVPIPRDITDELAAATHLKGMTTEMLVERVGNVKKGDVVLMHSASGGVGLLLCQWAKARGATVIGTASSALKCKEITRAGAKHAIDTSKKDVAKEVAKITKGQGVDVVFDPVGKDTYETSLACLKDRGLLASFGGASGPVPDVNLNEFRYMARAWRLTRASLFNYTAGREDLLHSSKRVFAMIRSGKVKVKIKQRYALKDAVQMHKDIESRKLTGITMLVP
ncbi:MAG: quinone oxidoreductase [Rhodospirillaceae bacterium]|jgi:NADPH2:quinone reductase|nr:quinone oxidoreductase [Rhodospirillaceae bacterium]MBT3810923.1 quinone oxidoreductase [Rhodospirillaceae bacterium]MBT3931641.1 quinone oxidoreductase [Rhodospirillaceae bacterium]MBT4771138.1 quinone oxidoreductase [Rhodospirillaceae bacterium]MBT5357763.1 quinone oxidoreductase [Rhodospirillaceae bacterium]